MPAIRARILSPKTSDEAIYIPDGYLNWDEEGTIIEVSPFNNQTIDDDLFPSLITPGFVDGHIHFPQTRIVGSASGPLLPWLEQSVFPEEARFNEVSHAQTVAEAFTHQLARSGTTLSVVYGSVHPEATDILLAKVAQKGLRMIAGPVLMNNNCPTELQLDVEPAMDGIRRLVDRWHGHDNGRLSVAVIPRFALSCTTEMMRAAGELAQQLDLWVTTHLSENIDECKIACEQFQSEDYLAVYEDVGLLHHKSLYAHCIHLSESELNRFSRSGAVIAHCPDSNFFLGSGQMPIEKIENLSIPLCIGSDIAAGRSFSIPKNCSAVYDNALLRNQFISPEKLLWVATCGGAKCLGENKLGKIEAGFEADFSCFHPPSWIDSLESSLAWLVLNRDLPPVKRLWVKGKEVHI
jgi:guanine deaminase